MADVRGASPLNRHCNRLDIGKAIKFRQVSVGQSATSKSQVTKPVLMYGKVFYYRLLDVLQSVLETSSDNIGLHLKNIYKEGELEALATTEDYSVVQTEGKRQVRRKVKHYNLDAVISVAYRVNSRKGTQFRQWATRLLKEHLTQGYTLNQQRFEANARELEAALKLVRKAANSIALQMDAGRGLVEIVSRYTQTFLWLQRYDEGLLNEPSGESGGKLPSHDKAMEALATLKTSLIEKGEATELFARSRGDGLSALLGP
ncbi:virulence RhuM family protein [Endozoicomonas sp. Mp262]|uniref:virulence RhuM family protein n=1 Tax=Endozoicomonas sp. Mp262 TaxID=2919499 RepID=UPI0021D920D5